MNKKELTNAIANKTGLSKTESLNALHYRGNEAE